ncbi:ABC transporter ATP-binding protein [Nitrospira sp.]|nr:ABC transporter ATP-binding protein [Nitrospira sp.]
MDTPEPTPILELKDVTVYREDTLVFDGLSLSLPCGVHTAILGPNGSGKSTFLKLLSGEVHPVSDERSIVRLMGMQRWNVWDLRAKLGLVSHDLHRDFDGSATGTEVLLSGFHSSIGVYPHQTFNQAQQDRVREVAGLIGILDLLDRPYARLSTGEQRRCLLGRALVHRPNALVLDEPTAGLDPSATFVYLDTVRRLMTRGTTVILMTHHLHEILPEVTRIVLLKRGRVVGDGPREEVLTREQISRLFGTSIELVPVREYVYAVPAG